MNAFADIVATAREISGNPLLIALILLAGGTSLLVGNAYHAQMPEFAHHLGHYEADFTYGMLLGADAAGALVAGLALESRGFLAPSARRAFTLAMLWCAVIVGFATTRSYPLAVALLFVAGFLELAYNAMAQTLVQLHAPAPIRGRESSASTPCPPWGCAPSAASASAWAAASSASTRRSPQRGRACLAARARARACDKMAVLNADTPGRFEARPNRPLRRSDRRLPPHPCRRP